MIFPGEGAVALTVKRVAKALRSATPGRHFDGQGLYLVVSSKKAAHWERRYELNHKPHWLGLGSARTFTLEEARERNRAVSKLLADGIDPLQQRRIERAARAAATAKMRTFQEAAEEYIQRHQSEWRSARHGGQWRTSLQHYVYPKIGKLDVAAIDKALVRNVLEQPIAGDAKRADRPSGKFWDVRTVTASRTRNRIELVLNYAIAAGYRPEGPNPAAWSGLKELLAAPAKAAPKVHHPAVPYAEVPTFLTELRRHQGVSVKALEFLILTAARTSEVLGATWGEIDWGAKVWTIPPERMKSKRQHRVPLSPPAIKLLRGLYVEDNNPYLFIGSSQPRLGAATLQNTMRRLGRGETVHGFRSAFSDWAHERTAHSNHTIELSLAHSIGAATEQAYRRGDMFDKRRKLLEAWGAFCTSPAGQSDNVVPIQSKGAP